MNEKDLNIIFDKEVTKALSILIEQAITEALQEVVQQSNITMPYKLNLVANDNYSPNMVII